MRGRRQAQQQRSAQPPGWPALALALGLCRLRRPLATPAPALPAAGRAHLDFTSWEATRQLTRALLQRDFGVAWDLPPGHLVPTLTNRANYVHWLADLLALSAPAHSGGPRPRQRSARPAVLGAAGKRSPARPQALLPTGCC